MSVKALSADVQFDQEPQLIAWARIASRHQALNWLRSCDRRAVALDETVLELVEKEWAREVTPHGGERIEALRLCLESLPARSRRMLELRYFDKQPCREVARALGVKLDAVYQRLARLHRALGECIRKRLATTPSIRPEVL